MSLAFALGYERGIEAGLDPVQARERALDQKPSTYCVLCDDDHGEVIGYQACRVDGETYCPRGVCPSCLARAFRAYDRLASVEPLAQLTKPLRDAQAQFSHAATRPERRAALRAIQRFCEANRQELILLHFYDRVGDC